MVRYKLFGILSMLIFSLPKVFPVSSASSNSSASPKESPATTRNEIKRLPIIKVGVKTEPIKPIKVSASVYFPVESQTDDTPLVTADNSKINEDKPGKHRWIAVSRNLLRRWGGSIDFGDTLHVKGISKKMDGPYIVRDTMNRRIKDRVDILVGPRDNKMGFWDNVKIYNLN